ncbi:MAG TPA: ZIP family metal transporter [Pyrinomonadaceae bacterium]|nr:ZIP family metal transporter [Pyrinomonadaceae bacterium]
MTNVLGGLSGIEMAVVGSAVTLLSTSAGALPTLFTRRISERTQDVLMGFSAGVMLAATCFSLLNPALRLAAEGSEARLVPGLAVGACVLAGGAFLHLCNRYVPHEHFVKGREGGPPSARLKRIWLFVLAIALHNFPEGLAVGSGAGSLDPNLAAPILAGIALQDIPEGFVVAVALTGVQYTRGQALFAAFVTGVVEAAAALVGYAATSQAQGVLPWALALSGGAMLYVISDEMIPESHRKEFAQEATAGLMAGFVLMMFLDTSLG